MAKKKEKEARPNLFPNITARVPLSTVLPAKRPEGIVETGPPPFPYNVADFPPNGRLLVLFGTIFGQMNGQTCRSFLRLSDERGLCQEYRP